MPTRLVYLFIYVGSPYSVSKFYRIDSESSYFLIDVFIRKYVISQSGPYAFYSSPYPAIYPHVIAVKLTLKINSAIYKIQKFTAVGIDPLDSSLAIPLVTTKPCRINLYWTGP